MTDQKATIGSPRVLTVGGCHGNGAKKREANVHDGQEVDE